MRPERAIQRISWGHPQYPLVSTGNIQHGITPDSSVSGCFYSESEAAAAADVKKVLQRGKKVLAEWGKERTTSMVMKRKAAKDGYLAECAKAEEMGALKPKKPKALRAPTTPEHLRIVLPVAAVQEEDEEDESEGEYDE